MRMRQVAGDKGEAGQTSDLAREAEKAKNPVVRGLFNSLRRAA